MNSFRRTLNGCIVMLLVCLLVAAPMAHAAQKSATPEKVHRQVIKLGMGYWVGVRLQDGTAFSGKIVSYNNQGFAVQLYNVAQPKQVAYSDVFELQKGMSASGTARGELTADTVHARILKRGLGNWTGVQLENGVAFCGRVVSIDQDSFGMQLYGDVEITPVAYNDVVALQQGASMKAFWIFLGAGLGGMAAISVVSIHEMNKKMQMPTQPTPSTAPIW
jgi:hypothetical protein